MRMRALFLSAAVFLVLQPAFAGGITTLDEAKKASAESGKLILVDGSADW